MPRPKLEIDDKEKSKATISTAVIKAPVLEPVVTEDDEEYQPEKWSNIVYEATIDGKTRRFPTTTITPRRGKFFVMRTYEADGRTRILVSPKDWNESFPFSTGPVLTKYGLTDGNTCNISLKLIDVMIDIASEEFIGVYLVVMTPSFAQIDVDVKKLIRTVTDYDVLRAKEEVMTHEALNMKYQLEEAMERAETYRQALFDRETNIVKLAEDFAAPIIETTLGALAATKDMFEQYYGQEESNWSKNKAYVIIMIIAIGLLGLYLAAKFLGGGG
jgi:hypothetical protein